MSSSVLKRLRTSVHRTAKYMFNNQLFAVNTFTSSVLMCVGDVVQQNAERYRKPQYGGYDWSRTARITVVGGVLGSIQHVFYCYLDDRYPTKNMRTICKKIVIDQTICTPLNIAVFIYGLGILECVPLDKINEEFMNKFFLIFWVDCIVFSPLQYINFKFIDPKYRLLFVNLISVVYNTFLSNIKYTQIIESLKMKNNHTAISKKN